MAIVSKSAQVLLDEELASYKNKIIERASVYAEHDGDSSIGEKQMKLAIRDSGTKELGDVLLVEAKQRKTTKSVIVWLLFWLLLVWSLFCIIYIEQKSYLQQELVVICSVSVMSLASILGVFMYYNRLRSADGKADVVVDFLYKWNEFESLLKYSYKSANKKENVPLIDLIQYYIHNISDDKKYDEMRIIKLLNIRNSLVHRGIKSFDEKILIRHTMELQDLIKQLKRKL